MNAGTGPRLRPIEELNRLRLDAFAEALQPLFEAARPLAEALRAEVPFTSYADLLARARLVAGQLSTADQIEILGAHPRIGETPAAVSTLSYREQGYAGEAGLPPDEVHTVYATLAALNRQYEAQFGFRCVVFVNGRPKSEIVEVLRERLHNSRVDELHTGLDALFLIASDRLRSLSG